MLNVRSSDYSKVATSGRLFKRESQTWAEDDFFLISPNLELDITHLDG
jgi:hypothetical protein